MNAENNAPQAEKEIATLGGGCFWCLEAVFGELQGVKAVESGYAGGRTANPAYREVCNGGSGHAEVVKITFDPAVVSYSDILQVFFTIHDPTTLNRQGNDVGSQYRSVVFYHSPRQKEVALQTISTLNAAQAWSDPIVTEVAPAPVYYPAENYHQRYFANNPAQDYCQFVVAPKVAKFRKNFLAGLKS